MGKRIVIVFIAALVLSIVFARQAEAKAVFQQNPASVDGIASLPMPRSVNPSTLDAGPFLRGSDIIILSPTSENTLEYSWVRLSNCQRQVHTITHSGHGNALTGTAHGSKLAQLKQFESASPVSLSGSLSSLSPPGLIPRL